MRRAIVPVLLLALAPAAWAADPHPVVTYSKIAAYADVRDDLKIAIENHALVIDNVSHIHNMLERTGKDLGATKTVFVNSESFSFCSAVISRRTMEADPHNIAFCPYTISVYTITREPDKVFISYQRLWRPDGTPSSKAALQAVDSLLDAIAREAMDIKK